jgi:hypothetical protein
VVGPVVVQPLNDPASNPGLLNKFDVVGIRLVLGPVVSHPRIYLVYLL